MNENRFGQSLISFAYFDDKMTWKP